jgi:hypothetical protein
VAVRSAKLIKEIIMGKFNTVKKGISESSWGDLAVAAGIFGAPVAGGVAGALDDNSSTLRGIGAGAFVSTGIAAGVALEGSMRKGKGLTGSYWKGVKEQKLETGLYSSFAGSGAYSGYSLYGKD